MRRPAQGQHTTLRLPQRLLRRAHSYRSGVRFLGQYLYAVTRSLSLLTGGLVSPDGRRRIRELATALGYGPRPRLPYVALKALVGPEVSIRVLEADISEWNVRLVDLVAINSIVARCAPQTAFEIGTGDGLTALNMAGNMPDGGRLHTLNLPPDRAGLPNEQKVGERFQGVPLEEKIVQLYGDSMSYDFARFHGAMDLVFVDGNHRAEAVANDTGAALRMVRGPGSVILWHDYGFRRGVTEIVDRLRERFSREGRLVAIQGTWIACLILGSDVPKLPG